MGKTSRRTLVLVLAGAGAIGGGAAVYVEMSDRAAAPSPAIRAIDAMSSPPPVVAPVAPRDASPMPDAGPVDAVIPLADAATSGDAGDAGDARVDAGAPGRRRHITKRKPKRRP